MTCTKYPIGSNALWEVHHNIFSSFCQSFFSSYSEKKTNKPKIKTNKTKNKGPPQKNQTNKQKPTQTNKSKTKQKLYTTDAGLGQVK